MWWQCECYDQYNFTTRLYQNISRFPTNSYISRDASLSEYHWFKLTSVIKGLSSGNVKKGPPPPTAQSLSDQVNKAANPWFIFRLDSDLTKGILNSHKLTFAFLVYCFKRKWMRATDKYGNFGEQKTIFSNTSAKFLMIFRRITGQLRNTQFTCVQTIFRVEPAKHLNELTEQIPSWGVNSHSRLAI
jgi:hypothetical protein